MTDGFTRREVLQTASLAVGTLGLSGLSAAEEASVGETSVNAGKPDLETIRKLLGGNQAVTWVFAGDSITHGARHLMDHRDYSQLFGERLRYELGQERNILIKTATSGWTLDRVAKDLDWRVLRYSPDVVSMHLGMNDCKQGAGALAAFRKLYPETIQRVRDTTSAAIIIHTPNAIIPGCDPGRDPHIAAYVDAIREVAEETQAVLIDNYAAWLEYMKNSQIFYLMNDAIHPNTYGHLFTAHLMFRELGMWDDNSAVCTMFVPN